MNAKNSKTSVKLARLFWRHRLYSIVALMISCLALWSLTLFTISTDQHHGNNNQRAMLTLEPLQAPVINR